MNVKGLAVAAVAPTLLDGCASLVGSGTSQDITVSTNPPGAHCVFWRPGEQIGEVKETPGTLTVKRRKYDIDIKCDKTDFEQASFHNHSGVSSMVAGNVAADLILTAGPSLDRGFCEWCG